MGTKAELIEALGGADTELGDGKTFTVNTSENTLAIATHGRSTGDGPFTVKSSNTAPGGLTAMPATGTLEVGTVNFDDGDTFIVGEDTYHFVDTLDEAYDVLIEDSIAAASTLTMSDNFSNGEVVTIGDVTYTFRTSLTEGGDPNDVLLGTDGSALEDSLSNLAAAINGAAGEGTAYGNGTEEHPDVDATSDATTLTVTAKVAGEAGNAIVVTSDASNGDDFDADGTLQDGADGSALTLDNLVEAINDGSGSGSKYHGDTDANEQVSAVATSSHLATFTAEVAGAAGNEIPLAVSTDPFKASIVLSGSTLSGGYDNLFFLVVEDANTLKVATSFEEALSEEPSVVNITTTGTGTHTIFTSAAGFAERMEQELKTVHADGNRVSLRDVLERRFWTGLESAVL